MIMQFHMLQKADISGTPGAVNLFLVPFPQGIGPFSFSNRLHHEVLPFLKCKGLNFSAEYFSLTSTAIYYYFFYSPYWHIIKGRRENPEGCCSL